MAGAAGVVGLVGVAAVAVVVGGATAGEAGAALLEGVAVVCPNIFDMRLVNIPIMANVLPAGTENQLRGSTFLQFTESVDLQRSGP